MSQAKQTCPRCHGTGRYASGARCRICEGFGRVGDHGMARYRCFDGIDKRKPNPELDEMLGFTAPPKPKPEWDWIEF